MAICGTNAEVISSLERYRGMDSTFDQGLDELITVTKYLRGFGVPEENFAVDLTIARGLDYYTGTVYETEMTDPPRDRLGLLRRALRQPRRVLHRQAAARRGHLHRPDAPVLCPQ
jgi:histidyl-tRNA synthetase (EC 6.1.1.21)